MKNKVTISPNKTIEIETPDGSIAQRILDVYASISGVQFTSKHSLQINGRPAVLDDEVTNGDRLIATENKAGASDELAQVSETTELESVEEVVVQTLSPEDKERVNDLFATAKNFIVEQVTKYAKTPIRADLVKPVADFVGDLELTEDEIISMLGKVAPAKRNLKWNKESLSSTDSKTYALEELKDKAETVTEGSLNQVVYQGLAQIIAERFTCEIKLLPCFHPACRTNEHIELRNTPDGWIAICNNPRHKTFPIATSAAPTEEAAKLAWNKMIKG